jgi:deoxyribose-phosphate aldolase
MPTPTELSDLSNRQLARFIDHTLLQSDAGREQHIEACDLAGDLGCAAVCVHPSWVAFCKDRLKNSGVALVSVVGFPLGATTTRAKAAEAADLVRLGADELDMVIHLGRLKEGDDPAVLADIRAVVEVAAPARVKAIIETALLEEEQKIRACLLSREAGAAFVKTCTGFQGGGATVEDIALMRRVVGPAMGVKASAGVRTAAQARALLAAGVGRLGASSTLAIVGQK